MCGGGGGSDDALNYQLGQEQKRKKRIAAGERDLERLFAPLEGDAFENVTPYAGFADEDSLLQAIRENWGMSGQQQALAGGPVTSTLAQALVPNFREMKTPQGLLDLGFTMDQIKGATRPEDLLRYYRDGSGQKRIEGGGTPIWEQHKQAYLDFANPQLDRQFDDAAAELTYALSRQGQTGGSLAVDRREDLETDRGQRQLEIAQTAQDYGNKARSDLSQQKSSLYQMLNSTANPGATSQAARSALASISSKPAMSPIGMLFQNTTAGLAGAVPAYREGQRTADVNRIIYGRDPDQGSGRVLR